MIWFFDHLLAANPAFVKRERYPMLIPLYRRQELKPFPRKRNGKKQNDCLKRSAQIATNSCEKKRNEK